MEVISRGRPVFLAPHYDDVALSCGGTVAELADAGAEPVIVTIFGGAPPEQLHAFARLHHARWGVAPGDAIDVRREEERCAASILGAEAHWLEIPDAIYRGNRYTSDVALFGPVHPTETVLPRRVVAILRRALDELAIQPAGFFVPLGVGNHVDHQHARAVGRLLAADGYRVLAYADYPYAGDPGGNAPEIPGAGEPVVRPLSAAAFERKIQAVLCYRSQHAVIFRHQGDPAEATRAFTLATGGGRPAERFQPLQPGD